MASIVFSSSKGGVGKTTSALILATTLAEYANVTLIDTDPSVPLKRWRERATAVSDNLTIITSEDNRVVNEDSIFGFIQEAEKESAFVVVDLACSASTMAGHVIAYADLVIVPMAASQLDADEAANTMKLIKRQEVVNRRKIPWRILFTRSPSAIRTRNMDLIQNDLREVGIKAFETHLNHREAFRAIFTYGATLRAEGLEKAVAGLPKAVRNADLFAEEVIETLKVVVKASTASGFSQSLKSADEEGPPLAPERQHKPRAERKPVGQIFPSTVIAPSVLSLYI